MRKAQIKRETKETRIEMELDLDGSGQAEIDTALPFLDHMLDSLAKHGVFNLKLQAKGDIETDPHHLIEDIAICFGQTLKKALGKKQRIARIGNAIVPMDDALVMVAIDIGGRAYLTYNIEFEEEKIGDFQIGMIRHFFESLTSEAKINLHIKEFAGRNDHHKAEALFKAFGRALDEATKIDERRGGVPSTKGTL